MDALRAPISANVSICAAQTTRIMIPQACSSWDEEMGEGNGQHRTSRVLFTGEMIKKITPQKKNPTFLRVGFGGFLDPRGRDRLRQDQLSWLACGFTMRAA